MQDQPDAALQQRRRNVASGFVGFAMFIGLAVFAWSMGSPSDLAVPPSAESEATPALEDQDAEDENADTEPTETDSTETDAAETDEVAAQQEVPAKPSDSPGVSDNGDGAGTTQEPGAASRQLQRAQAALAADAPVTALVLGDSTSEDTRTWVHLWARSLAEVRPVSIAHWDAVPDPDYYPTVELSNGSGASPLMIWNGSVAEGTAATAQEDLAAFVRETPDVVLLNFGRSSNTTDFAAEMGSLVEEIRGQFGDIPVLMVVQNPQDAEADLLIREAGKQWAGQADVGLLDVAAEFPAPDNDLPVEATSTSANGQQLWARFVTDALG